MQYLYGQNGATLPRVAYDQYRATTPVSLDQAQPGDLVFFKDTYDAGNPENISHVAIYQGNGQFIGAQGNDVNVDSLSSPYWSKHFVGVRRVAGAESPNPPDSSAPADGAIAPQGDASPNPPDTSAPTDIESFIRQRAAHYGIDPDTAVAVAQSEGGLQDWTRQSDYVDPTTGQREQSFGPFQLYVNGGLGNAFQQQTGMSPADPKAGPAAVDFALSQAAKGGWGPWHGAARVGIGQWQGIGGQPAGGDQSALAPNTNEYHGQMQGADGTPVSQSSSPFGGTDQSSQYDPSLPQDQQQGGSPFGPVESPGSAQYVPPSVAPDVGQPPTWPPPAAPDSFGQRLDAATGTVLGRAMQNQNVLTGEPIYNPEDVPAQAALARRQAEATGRALHLSPAQMEQAYQENLSLLRNQAGGMAWPGGGLSAVADEGQAARAAEQAAGAVPPATRMYHGTGSAFETPTPDKFDPNGLYGPGYYLTSDPRVAGSYAAARNPLGPTRFTPEEIDTIKAQIQQDYPHATFSRTAFIAAKDRGDQKATLLNDLLESDIPYSQANAAVTAATDIGMQANVRAVNVPRGLRLLNMEQELPDAVEVAAYQALRSPQLGLDPEMVDELHRAVASELAQNPTTTGHTLWNALKDAGGGDPYLPNAVLHEMGYDGISYAGGKIMPLTDAAGQAVEHTAYVIFPESLSKITNALSGKAGGTASLATAVHLGSAAAGAGLGYEADPNASPEERLRNAALGGVAGYGAARALTAGAGARGAYLSGLPIEGAGAADENLRAAQLVREENAARATGAPPLARPFTPASGLRDLQAEKRAFTFDASNLFHDLRQALPNPADRSDLTHAIEHPEARDALNPTQQDWLTKLTDTNEAAWQYAHDHGILDSYLENYISHIVQKPPEDVAKALSTGNRLSTFSQFTKQRTFPTIEDLQQYIADNHLPWKVHTDPAVIVPAHALSLQKAAANNAYLEMLKGATASDGRPLLTAAADAPRDYRTLASTALQKFKWQDTNAEGKPIFQTVPLSVHPEAYGPLERVLGEPLQTKVLPAPYWSAAGLLKRGVMYNPIVHGINTLSQAAKVSSLGPLDAGLLIGKGIHLLDDPASRPIVRQAIADGLNLASLRELGTELGTAMKLPLDIQQETNLLGRIGRVLAKPIHYSDALLWDKLVSGTQLGIHQTLKARFVQQGMAEADAGKRAAQMANTLSGMIPTEDLSRAGKFWGDLLLFANRWTQGALVRPLRGMVGDVTPLGTKLAGTPFGLTPEDVKAMAPAYRGTVLRGMLSMAAITTGLNYALAGHGPWENDPGHLLDIDSGRKDASGNRIYYPNPLFRIEQELASAVADLVPGGAKATGTTLPSLAFAKTAQLPKEALSLGANENLGAMLKDNSPHPIYKAGDDFWTALGKVAQHAAQGLLPVRGVPIGAVRMAGSATGLLGPEMMQRGLGDVRGGILNVYDKTTNLRLNEQQGDLGDELRRLKVGVGVPAQQGLDDATYQAYRAALVNAQRDAFTRLLANPQYTSATDREKTLMLKDALRQTEATVGETYRGTQPPASGAPPKYTAEMLPPELQSPKYQQDPYALERDVNAAVQAVADYRRGGGPLPSTREQYLALLTRYATPEWQQWAYEHRVPMAQQRSQVRSTVNDALGAMDAVPQPATVP